MTISYQFSDVDAHGATIRAQARGDLPMGSVRDGARPEREVIMKRTLVTASCLAGIVIAGAAAAPAYGSPGGGPPGPPNQTCQNTANPEQQLSTPGNAGSAPGSVFNEPGFGSPNGGTGGNAYNAAGAPSQYDVACVANESGGLSPPSPTTTAPTPAAKGTAPIATPEAKGTAPIATPGVGGEAKATAPIAGAPTAPIAGAPTAPIAGAPTAPIAGAPMAPIAPPPLLHLPLP